MVLQMDWGTSMVVISVVLVAGGLVLKFIDGRRNPLTGVTRADVFEILKGKLKEFVSIPTCKANVKGLERLQKASQETNEKLLGQATAFIEKEIATVNETLQEGIDEIKIEIRNNNH